MKCLGGQICFTILPDSLIDSIEEAIDHIHCENTSQRIFDQSFFSVTLCGVRRTAASCGSRALKSVYKVQISADFHPKGIL